MTATNTNQVPAYITDATDEELATWVKAIYAGTMNAHGDADAIIAAHADAVAAAPMIQLENLIDADRTLRTNTYLMTALAEATAAYRAHIAATR